MKTIEERAHKAQKEWLLSDDVAKNGYEQGYIKGAEEQKEIDFVKYELPALEKMTIACRECYATKKEFGRRCIWLDLEGKHCWDCFESLTEYEEIVNK